MVRGTSRKCSTSLLSQYIITSISLVKEKKREREKDKLKYDLGYGNALK